MNDYLRENIDSRYKLTLNLIIKTKIASEPSRASDAIRLSNYLLERGTATRRNFQFSTFNFIILHLRVCAHTLVQEEKSDRNYKKDYRTDRKGNKNIVHTLNKKVVERP